MKYNIAQLKATHFVVEQIYYPIRSRKIRDGIDENHATPEDIKDDLVRVEPAFRVILKRPDRPNVEDLQIPWHSFQFSDIIIHSGTGAVLKEWNNNMSQTPPTGIGRSSMYGSRSVAFMDNPDYDSYSSYNYLYAMIYPENGSLRILRQKPDDEFMEVIPYDGGYTDPIPPPTIIYHWPYTTYFSAPDPYGFIGDGRFYVTCGYNDFYLNSSSVAVDVYYGIDAAHKVLTIPFGRTSGQSELQNYTIMLDRFVDNSYTSDTENTIYLRNYSRHSNLACDGTYTLNGHPSSGYHTSANVVCHELGHALINRTAHFNYYASYHLGFLVANSESAGLHEGNAEIFSSVAVQYGRQGMTGLPNTPNIDPSAADGLNFDNWYDVPALVYDSKLWAHPDQTTMFNNSYNINYWSAPLGGGLVEVHDAGKPAERFFCHLVLGAFTDPNQRLDQRYNPWINMSGIGMDAAYRVWHRGLTVYCTSNTGYQGWLQAIAHAAKDIYGNPSTELTAVREAAKTININIDSYNP
ncbi:MAG: M4 family metallopeptidase [Holophagaceae bacterium]